MIEILSFNKSNITETDKVKYICNVLVDGEDKSLTYEFDKNYEKYFCNDRVDGVIVMILLRALINNHDIKSKLPMSKKLYFQLTNYLIPWLIEETKDLKIIKIDCPLISEKYDDVDAVGVSMSCGIDSLYAFYKNYNDETLEDYKINQLFCCCLGNGFNVDNSVKFGNYYNLPTLYLKTNYFDATYKKTILYGSEAIYYICGCVLMFSKLFKVYHVPSNGAKSYYFFHPHTLSECYSMLLFKLFSTENTEFYDSDNAKRTEKTEFVSNIKTSYETLNVCWNNTRNNYINCGICDKCLPTLLTLDILGKLDKYGKVFDIQEYKRNRVNNFAVAIEKQSKDTFYKDLLEYAKERGVSIPKKSYKIAKKSMRKKLRFNKKMEFIESMMALKRKLLKKKEN